MNIQLKRLDDSMLILAPEQIENLAASLRGELLTTKDDAYEDARQAWPGMA